MLLQKNYLRFDLHANGGFQEKMKLMDEKEFNKVNLPIKKEDADRLPFFQKVDD